MCGIAGKVSAHGSVDPRLVERMCELIEHRGPDSRGMHVADGVALGIQRLRIIDLETGDQPIYNEDRSVAVVLNGEIYNYRELRRELEGRGHTFRTRSDTEVIAHLYEERGPELVEELHGMFAFAVWDERTHRLLLARDRVGKKPLFYAAGDGWLTFASELRSLMADEGVGREVDPSSIDCLLAYGYIPAPYSIWRGVKKLPPAHVLVWEGGRADVRRYWDLDFTRKRHEDPRELQEELRRLVGEAVRRRMIADVPLGAFLSGGVDSSIVVAEMAAASAEPVKTFSVGFDAEEYNELPRARVIAERFETDHHEFVVKPEALELIPRIVTHYGEPYADPSAIPSFYLAELTRSQVTVALNGDGGDESFAGYLRHLANSYTARMEQLPAFVGRGAAAIGHRLPKQPGSFGAVARAQRLLVSLDVDPVERYTRHVSIFNAEERAELLTGDFAAQLDTTRARDVIAAPWAEANGTKPLDRLLAVDVRTYLPEDLLVKMDIATMAHSLEARSPLLDHAVMEFAASVPPRYKARRAKKKWLLREAYRGRVPDAILDGTKKGFAVPLDHWFRHELRDHARDVLLDPRTLDRGYTRREPVEALLDAHARGAGDRSRQIWALLMLEMWHRQFVDQANSQPVQDLAGT